MVSEIKEMMTFYPTEEEFTNPIEYVERLYSEGADDYGCIKIVPPESFRPPVAFDQFSE